LGRRDFYAIPVPDFNLEDKVVGPGRGNVREWKVYVRRKKIVNNITN